MAPIDSLLNEYEKNVSNETNSFSPQLIELAEHLHPLLIPQLRSKRKVNGIKTTGDLMDETEQFNAALHHLKVHDFFLFLVFTRQFNVLHEIFKDLIPSNKFWTELDKIEKGQVKVAPPLIPKPNGDLVSLNFNQYPINFGPQELFDYHVSMHQHLVQERTRLISSYIRARTENYISGAHEIIVNMNRTIELVRASATISSAEKERILEKLIESRDNLINQESILVASLENPLELGITNLEKIEQNFENSEKFFEQVERGATIFNDELRSYGSEFTEIQERTSQIIEKVKRQDSLIVREFSEKIIEIDAQIEIHRSELIEMAATRLKTIYDDAVKFPISKLGDKKIEYLASLQELKISIASLNTVDSDVHFLDSINTCKAALEKINVIIHSVTAQNNHSKIERDINDFNRVMEEYFMGNTNGGLTTTVSIFSAAEVLEVSNVVFNDSLNFISGNTAIDARQSDESLSQANPLVSEQDSEPLLKSQSEASSSDSSPASESIDDENTDNKTKHFKSLLKEMSSEAISVEKEKQKSYEAVCLKLHEAIEEINEQGDEYPEVEELTGLLKQINQLGFDRINVETTTQMFALVSILAEEDRTIDKLKDQLTNLFDFLEEDVSDDLTP